MLGPAALVCEGLVNKESCIITVSTLGWEVAPHVVLGCIPIPRTQVTFVQ